MDEVIIRLLQGRASEAEAARLQRWRRQSGKNETHFREVEQTWRLLALAEPLDDARPRAVWDARRERPVVVRHRSGNAGRGRHWRRVAAVAAAIALIALATQGLDRPDTPPNSLAATEFVTSEDENATVRLGDGSVVRLGPESRVRVAATDKERGLWLEGQAFFAVAPDPARPFVVRTDAGEARALGTRFDVLIRDDAMTVLVVEGSVSVSAGGEEVEVGPSQMSHQERGAGPSVVTVEDPERMLGWMGRFLVFQSTPLSQAAVEIEARYGFRIGLADSVIAQRTITAWFTDQDLHEVLTTICRVANARCSIGAEAATMNAH